MSKRTESQTPRLPQHNSFSPSPLIGERGPGGEGMSAELAVDLSDTRWPPSFGRSFPAFHRGNRGLAFILLLSLGCLIPTNALADNWYAFRGSDTRAASDATLTINPDGTIPVAWSTETLGRGISSPLLVGGWVVVTGSGGQDERDLTIEAYDAADGHRVWVQRGMATGRPYTHPTSANASPSPATDGQSIVALFSSCDLLCVGVDGSPRWFRALAVDHPQTGNDVSMSSSPVIHHGVVAVQLENQGDSFIAGIDLTDGQTLWTRPRPRRSGWTSPIAVDLPDANLPGGNQTTPAFIFKNGDGLEVVAARSGELLRSLQISAGGSSSTTLVADRDAAPMLLVPGDGVTALDLSSGDWPELWNNDRLSSSGASPAVGASSVYTIKGSLLVAADIETGELRWRQRLPDIGSVWSTPVVTGSGIFIADQSGQIAVVADRDDEAEVIGSIDLQQPVLSTPAVGSNAIYIRADRKIVCLGRSPSVSSR